jgi:hypothetical protein
VAIVCGPVNRLGFAPRKRAGRITAGAFFARGPLSWYPVCLGDQARFLKRQLVTGLDDIAVVSEPVEQGRGQFGEDVRPFGSDAS